MTARALGAITDYRVAVGFQDFNERPLDGSVYGMCSSFPRNSQAPHFRTSDQFCSD
jgi:hypothetical protein